MPSLDDLEKAAAKAAVPSLDDLEKAAAKAAKDK